MPHTQKVLGSRIVASGTADMEGDNGSARRLLRVLLSFREEAPAATAEQLARRTNLPLSSTYRYLAMLREVGLVEERGRQGFVAGRATLRLAAAARAANPLEELARLHLQELVVDAEETAVLVRQHQDDALIVDCVTPARPVHVRMTAGTSDPMDMRGAGPKMLLAALPEAIRGALLRQRAVRIGLDGAWIENGMATLRQVADAGWCLTHAEVYPEAFAVGVPIGNGALVQAVLCIAAPASRMSGPAVEHLRDLALRTAANISAELYGFEDEGAGPVATHGL